MTTHRGARFWLTALAVLVAVTAAPGRARAQRGVDSQTFHPALDSYGIFAIERAQTSRQWDFGFKLFLNYAANPMQLDMFDAVSMKPKRQAVIRHATTLNFGMHLGLTHWLQLAIDVPVSAQSFTDAYGKHGSAADSMLNRTGFYSTGPITNVPPPDAAANDVRVALKARLFRKGVFGMALAGILTVPFGDDAAFLGNRDFTFRPVVIADVTRGPITFAVNLGAVVRQEAIVLDPHELALRMPKPRILVDVGHEFTWGAGIAYRFVQWVGIAAEAYGSVPLVIDPRSKRDTTGDVLGGLQIFPTKDLVISVGAGAAVFASATRHADYRVFGGLTWAPSEGQKGAVTVAGIDTDSDGISDSQDLCPGEAEDKDGFDDEDGCPDYDNDQDGLIDKQDKCPGDAEDKDGFQDDDGCPEVDNDNDGIPDAQDKCPGDPEDRDGFQDDDGCPDADNDGDGLADAQDKCPNEAETRNGVDDEDGCPDSGGQVATPAGRVDLAERVQFDAGKAGLGKPMESLLDKIAERLKANPQVKRVRIEGHADDPGNAKKNADLSQSRADAVRDYLIRKGVEPERLQAVGYGNTRPVEKARSADARAKNRRAEFVVVEQ